MERKIWQQASAEPTASPSGRAWEVSRKRLRRSMWLRTSFNISALHCDRLDCGGQASSPALRGGTPVFDRRINGSFSAGVSRVHRFSPRTSANGPTGNTIPVDAAAATVQQFHGG